MVAALSVAGYTVNCLLLLVDASRWQEISCYVRLGADCLCQSFVALAAESVISVPQ